MPVGNGEMSCSHYLNATITIQITNGIKGVYSIAEVVDDSNKRPEKTIFLNLYKTYERSGESKQMAHSLKAVENMLKANGAVVFSGEKALLEVAKYLNTVEG